MGNKSYPKDQTLKKKFIGSNDFEILLYQGGNRTLL